MSCVVTKLVPAKCPPELDPLKLKPQSQGRQFDPVGNLSGGPGPGGRAGAIPYCGTPSKDVALYTEWWNSFIYQYGIRVDYYANTFRIADQASMLYGDNPARRYSPPKRIMAMVEMNPESSILSRFGIQINSDAKIVISFTEFRHFFGDHAYPKAGDLMVLVDAHCDRPPGFGQKVYEVTSKKDEIYGETNFQGRHYVWTLDATRYTPSYEPGAPEESSSVAVVSESEKIGATDNPITKSYKENADSFAEANHDPKAHGSRDFVYGGY